MYNLVEALKRKPVNFVVKPWGWEKWLVNDEKNNYCGKILHIKAGHRFSCHAHDLKFETFMVLVGKANLWLLNTNDASVHHGILNAGDCIDIARLLPHEVEAIEDTDILEISTFHRDSDSYRYWRK